MYEHRRTPPITPGRFLFRMLKHLVVVLLILGGSLGLGMGGYERYEHLPWRDAFLNAAMLLGGMGPVNRPLTPEGKLFAGCYALFAGLVFLIAAGVLLAPMVHRIAHRLHWQDTV
jgi:hypothetical protein